MTTTSLADDQASPSRPGRSSDIVMALRQNTPLLAAIALFLVLWIFYNAFHPRGFSPQVMVQNANEAFALALVAMAQTVPVLAGGLDLSVGAVMTLVNCIASHLLTGTPAEIAFGILVCLVSGALAGLINGLVVVYGRIQPIIATLATGAVYIGLALMLRPEPGGEVDEDLNWAMTNALPDLAETYGWRDGDAAGAISPGSRCPSSCSSSWSSSSGCRSVAPSPAAPSTPSARPRAPPTCRASTSTAPSSRPSPWPASSPASPGSTSPSRPRRAMPTSRRPAPTRSTPSRRWSSAAPRSSAARLGDRLDLRRLGAARHLLQLPHLRRRPAAPAAVRGDRPARRGLARRHRHPARQEPLELFR